ncbi:MAG: response regulator transcription factor [Christensenella sp.]|uniref:response regulator transcription factor n=1 Tax=Christensenella sp. TaxID=1935934 RepID=UPI002B1FCFC4|nr:response regulator transcription factor [Christensenella sp.]MEA5004614.1 response regulator transcription factor [Christensenella sp.]
MKTSIMIVEDDQAIRNFMTATLDLNAYQCIAAESGEQALMYAVTNRPDIIILDLGLPDMDGVDIIKKLRTWSHCPIIVVSARSEDRDKISALDAGADDYLTKPFSMDELLARLRVAVRKLNPAQAGEEAVFENGGLKIDYAAGCVYLDGQECHLTPMEYKLVCLLAKNVGRVLTHKYILKEVWNSTLESDIPSLRVFMATLRKKIDKEQKYIQTHIGVGYRMLRIADGE